MLLAKHGWFLRCFGPSRRPSQGWPVETESSQQSVSLKAMMSSPYGGGAPATHLAGHQRRQHFPPRTWYWLCDT